MLTDAVLQASLPDILRALEGADINAVTTDVDVDINHNTIQLKEATPLILASACGSEEVVHLLLKRGAGVCRTDKFGWTALHWACRGGYTSVAELLMVDTADIDAKNENGRTALHVACQYRQPSMVELLLNRGADVTTQDHQGNTALHVACQNYVQNYDETSSDLQPEREVEISFLENICIIVRLLDNGAGCEVHSQDGSTALHFACRSGYTATAKILLNRGAEIAAMDMAGRTPLHFACWEGHPTTAELLLNSGADITFPNEMHGLTALHFACQCGHTSTAQLLLDRGADVTVQDQDGHTALHEACADGFTSTAVFLLSKGADIKVRDKEGKTALFGPCWMGHTSTAAFLLDRGADIAVQDKDGRTTLHEACDFCNTYTVELLLSRGVDVTVQDQDGKTALHCACERKGHTYTVEVLLDAGAEIAVQDANGRTALHCICIHRTDPTMQFEDHTNTAELLLDRGADITAKDQDGNTPLHLACIYHSSSTAMLLLDRGADVQSVNKEGKNPLDYCWYDDVLKEKIAALAIGVASSSSPSKANTSTTPLYPCTTANESFWRKVLKNERVRAKSDLLSEQESHAADVAELNSRVAILLTEKKHAASQQQDMTHQLNVATTEANALKTELTAVESRLASEQEENNRLAQQLEREISRRRSAEAALHRALYANVTCSFTTDNEPITHLQRCCDNVCDTTVTEAIFGGGPNGPVDGESALVTCLVNPRCSRECIDETIELLRGTVTRMPARGRLSVEHALAIHLYTYQTSDFKPFAALNNAFYGPDRSPHTLRRQLPFMKLLIQSLRALGDLTGFVENTVVYRAVSVAISPYLQKVYNDYASNSPSNTLAVGTLLRFPTFTSTSRTLEQEQLDTFGSDIIYEIHICAGHRIGVSISDLSYFRNENEVLMIPPVSMEVTELRMEDRTLRIVLRSQSNKFTYLSS